jgi:hypothetical protein
MGNKRLLSIDVLRGFAIVVLVIIHRIHYTWDGMKTHESVKTYMSGPLLPVLIFFIVLLSMAGVFYFMTGIVNTYTIHSGITKGKNKWHQSIFAGIAVGIWLIILNYIQRLFFMNGFLVGENGGIPQYPVGYVTGFIRDPGQVRFYWTQITEPGTLSLIGLIVIIVSILVSLLLKFKNFLNLNRMHIILLLLAIAALFASIFVKLHLSPKYEAFLESQRYLKAIICGHLCRDFSLFPYLGYAIIGSAMGLSLAENEDKKIFKRKSIFTAIGLIIIGLLIFLVFDKNKFGGRGTLGAFASLVELAIFVFLLLFLLKIFDNSTEEKQQRRRLKSKWIRRFGMLSLTVFMFEPVLAEILAKVIDFFAGLHWRSHFLLVFLFALFCLLVWHLLLKLWQKASYLGSLEWLTGWVLLKLVRKKSGKINFKEL